MPSWPEWLKQPKGIVLLVLIILFTPVIVYMLLLTLPVLWFALFIGVMATDSSGASGQNPLPSFLTGAAFIIVPALVVYAIAFGLYITLFVMLRAHKDKIEQAKDIC